MTSIFQKIFGRRSKQVIQGDSDRRCELPEPFAAQVLYEGKIVADLSDREWVEMFWRDYKIVPVNEEAKQIIEDDDLWDHCRFDFRDPVSEEVCTGGFVGGSRPFVKDGKVLLRGLYFGGPERTKDPEQAEDTDAE